MLEAIGVLLEGYGYPIVFGAALLESVFVMGMVVPGQVVVLVAALTTPFSELNPMYVAVLAAAGDATGTFASILIGRWAGPWAFSVWHRRFGKDRLDLTSVRAFAAKRGALALLIGRPAWGLKNVLPVVVGASDMPVWKAMGFVVVASIVYYPLLVGGAYGLGFGVERAARTATWAGIAVLVGIALVVGWVIWRRRIRART